MMTSDEITALEAQVSQLDRDTARRVARLVLECRVSLRLALLAVQDADRSNPKRNLLQPGRAKRVGQSLFAHWRSLA
jgi:hypothetical protein